MEDTCIGIGAILVSLGISVAIIIWGYNVGKQKGKPGLGVLLAIFLGIIGVIIMYCLPDEKSFPSPTQADTRGYRKHYENTYGVQPVQGQRIQMRPCNHCSRYTAGDGKFCAYCGHQLGAVDHPVNPSERTVWDKGIVHNQKCPRCNSPAPPDARFCPYCGQLLS